MTESMNALRGIGSFSYSVRTILCRSDVNSVAQVITDMREAKSWQQNVVGQVVELTEQCFVVFRLTSHQWTQIIGRDRVDIDSFQAGAFEDLSTEAIVKKLKNIDQNIHVNENDAEILSEFLETHSIFFNISSTADSLRYNFYLNGNLLEKLKTTDWYSIPDLESSLRSIEVKQVGDTRQWVDKFFREQDAYIPDWNFTDFAGYFRHKPGDKIVMPDGDFERLDFIAL